MASVYKVRSSGPKRKFYGIGCKPYKWRDFIETLYTRGPAGQVEPGQRNELRGNKNASHFEIVVLY